jgi:Pentapeptide repeats (8 copies)
MTDQLPKPAIELAEILRLHSLWLRGESGGRRADLSGDYLSEADLSQADLSMADLSGADLRQANLRHADLSMADLSMADLSGADLRQANLRHADLSMADLSMADLRQANLRHADLSQADLRGADLRQANLSRANLILLGQDERGYLFYATPDADGIINIYAGCQHFIGINEARQHWLSRHQDDPILHEDCLSFVDRAERMAAVRGWKLERGEADRLEAAQN